MKLISCIIRPDRLAPVKEALFRAGVTGITITRVSGHGGESDLVTVRRGSKFLLEFREKVKLEMACSEPFVEATINAIVSAARTGSVGDGKILGRPHSNRGAGQRSRASPALPPTYPPATRTGEAATI